MTATILQEELVKELNKIFAGQSFMTETGERKPLNVYEQQLPERMSDEDPEPIPYIIVRLETGITESSFDPQVVSVTMIFAYYDNSPENNGHKGVLSMMQKVHERFEKEPMLAKQFMFTDPFNWALQDEESFPFFFGAASMKFNTAAIRREDRFA